MRVQDSVYFCPPGRLIIRPGARAELPQLVAHLGWRNGVLVTDKFFAEQTPWARAYVDAAAALGISTIVFDGGAPDPTTVLCDEATRSLREALDGRAPDHIVALGGGSNIDLAKALSLTLPAGRPIAEFVDGVPSSVRPIPLIAVPTTAGTGSEATPGAILVDPHNATKVAVMDNALRPQVAVIDPELTYSCPPRVTADAGLDALTHAIESYLTIDSWAFDRGASVDPGYSGRSSVTMMFARESIALCARYLLRAYENGRDVDARIGMSYASVYAALSYGSAGLNAVHGIAYAVAGETHRTHGSTNAVMLPYVLQALAQTRTPELVEIARLFDIRDQDPGQAVTELCARLRHLVATLGIPTTLKDFGVAEERLPALCDDALGVVRLAKAFPVADVRSAYRDIVQRAYRGELS